MNPAGHETIDQRFDAIYKEAEERRNAFREDPVPKIQFGMAVYRKAAGVPKSIPGGGNSENI